ncbi:MAG: RNA methyltransferase [Azonexus sp.]|nr:RNA methyltransferase [Azonexus sp.]MCK6412965.1 RNA methyltransferase [Azonexus sp.]
MNKEAPPQPASAAIPLFLPQLATLREWLRRHGARTCHEERVLRAWCQVRSLDNRHSASENFLPLALRGALPDIEAQLEGLARVVSEHPGEDGSARLLVGLADGQTVESVLLPRDGVCVSTQVGCAVGCVFCMTGKDGLLRQLGSAEIVAQVVLARRRRPVKKVVFMGMGEPAHNLDNVLEAIDFLGTLGGIGHKNLVFSTVGDPRVFERLGQGPVKPALALSLHSTRAELRAELLPRAPRMTPEELVAAGEAYARATGYPIQYQWTLIDGVNDSEEELEGIVRLLSGKYALMNMIPYNSVAALPYRRPDPEKARAIARWLHERRILTKLRNSAGQDIDGGCGQLRARITVDRHIAAKSRRQPGTTSTDDCQASLPGASQH